MPRRRSSQPAQADVEIKQFDSEAEIDRGIEKLLKCKSLLDELWDGQVLYNDPRTTELTHRIRNTVLDVFGPASPEYGRLRYHRVWHGGEFVNMDDYQIQAGFRDGIPHTAAALKGLIDRLEEARADINRDPIARTRAAFEGLELHPRIEGVASDLYRGGHYRQSVLDASIALINYVREKSGRHDLDGAPLMSTVFSSNNPVLAFNQLADQTDRDEQQGMMYLFMGAVQALRNPRAHSVFDDAPELALDAVAFISMLAKRLDKAKKN